VHACWKRWCLGSVAALMLLGGGMVAAAAPAPVGPGTPSLVQGVARALGVPPTKLEAAIRAAELERWNAFASANHIPEARAKAGRERIQNEPVTLTARFGGGAKRGLMTAAAGYLGLPPEQLAQELRSGKTLSEVTAAHGKSTDGLKAAVTAAAERELAARVQAGELAPDARDRMLEHLKAHMDELIHKRLHQAVPPTAGRPLLAG